MTTPEEIAERIKQTKLPDATPDDMLRIMEMAWTLGDLDPTTFWAYLHAKQNKRIISQNETIIDLLKDIAESTAQAQGYSLTYSRDN